ncbi:phage protease [Coraliomargarita sp. W4R72]
MHKFATGSRIHTPTTHADFANAAPETVEMTGLPALGSDHTAVGANVECLANAIEIGPRGEDGFYKLTPYGRHPYGDGSDLQVVDASAADAMVRRFDAANSKLVMQARGGNAYRPVYEGHPDHPAFSAQGDDNFTLQAEITQMQSRADGLYVKPDWKDAGNALLTSGTKLYWSPRWVVGLSGREGNVRVWRPFKLLSAGLTPTPNIMGCAANARPQNTTHTNTMENWKKNLLKLLGYSEPQITAYANAAADAPTVEEVEGKVATFGDMANGYYDLQIAIMRALGYSDEQIDGLREEGASAPSVDELTTRLKTALGATDMANATLTTTQAELVTAQESLTAITADLANSRTAHATLAVENAIAAGRITEAQRDARIDQICQSADFANALQDLSKEESKLPTDSQSRDLGKRTPEMQDMANARATFNQKLEDFANSKGLDLHGDYQGVYSKFKKTDEGKALLGKMSAPAE